MGKLEKQDMVNHPSHYQGKNGLEVLDVIKAFAPCPEYVEGYCWGNIVKYLMRYHQKNGVEDLKKGRVYLDWLIEALEEKE